MTMHEQAVIEAARRVVRTFRRRCKQGRYVVPAISIVLLAAALEELEG